MTDKLVSILIPVYNREKYISKTINSALSQTYKNLEIIVVDNASTDATWKIISAIAQDHPVVKVYKNEQNIGPVKNWCRCVQEASGEFGKILWSDDLMAPDFIEKGIFAINQSDNIGFVFSAVGIINDSDEQIDLLYHQNGSSGVRDTKNFIKNTLKGDSSLPVSPGCALFRMKSLRESLLVDIPNQVNADTGLIAIGNDLLLFLLTCSKFDSYYYLPEVGNFFRVHEGSITVSSERGKLSAYYSMSIAYFISCNPNIDSESVDHFNARIFVQRVLYGYKRYGFDTWMSMYPKPIGHKLNLLYVADFLIKRIVRMIKDKFIVNTNMMKKADCCHRSR